MALVRLCNTKIKKKLQTAYVFSCSASPCFGRGNQNLLIVVSSYITSHVKAPIMFNQSVYATELHGILALKVSEKSADASCS